jgi:hypothetical protein
MLGYMRAGNWPLGLLINFDTLRLKDGIFRRINADAIPARIERRGSPVQIPSEEDPSPRQSSTAQDAAERSPQRSPSASSAISATSAFQSRVNQAARHRPTRHPDTP